MGKPLRKTYRLVLDDDGDGMAHTIEFEASGAEVALILAERHCQGCTAEVFEEGNSLGRLQNVAAGGFWVITPAPKATGTRPVLRDRVFAEGTRLSAA